MDNISSSNTDVWVYEQIEEGLTFSGWNIFLGARGEMGVPIEAFLRVYAKKDGHVLELHGPHSLTELGGLSILTTNQAIAAVRLFTKKEYAPYFQYPHYIELIDTDIRITHGDDSFIIERELGWLTADDDVLTVFQVQETITKDGSYRIRRIERIKSIGREILKLPIIE